MKKTLLILIVLLISSTFLFAQKKGIGIGGNVYFPVGDWAEYASTGWGGSIDYEHPLGRNTLGVIYSGYTSFGSSDDDVSNSTWTMVPLLAGAKFYFTPAMNVYGAALIGVNFVTLEVEVEGIGEATSETETEFAGNLAIGYEFKLSEKGAIDLSGGFVYINELSYFGIRLAYLVKL